MKRIALIMATLVLSGCAGQMVVTAGPAGTPGSGGGAVQGGTNIHKPGDTVTVQQNGKDYVKITVSDVQTAASYTSGKGYPDKPRVAGNVYISANVAYEALADGVEYNTFDWTVTCAGVAVNNWTIELYGPKPELGSGSLSSGQKASGFLIYEVPPKGEVRMSYGGDPATFIVVIRAS
jgi:hypothetical protein